MNLANSTKNVSLTQRVIPFNRIFLSGKEGSYIQAALESGELAGGGQFAKKCHRWMEQAFGSEAALLTTSGTSSLEMAALILDAKPGDEVIMPSFTFVTTASAFVRAGLVPVFVDVNPDTLNIDVAKVEKAIGPKTKAIVPVHYAGIGCEMQKLKSLCKAHNLSLFEDAAHAFLAKAEGKYLATTGDVAVLSFHQTKNVVSGEGGALLINNPELVEKAHRIWHKGTNRKDMENGLVDKYTWVDLGSSFMPSELVAAMIFAQFEKAHEITAKRANVMHKYHAHLEKLEEKGFIKRMQIPSNCESNGHIYWILTKDQATRDRLLDYLKQHQIEAYFHYVPLHSSESGKKYGRYLEELKVTDDAAQRLVRLPFWAEMEDQDIEYVCEHIQNFFQ